MAPTKRNQIPSGPALPWTDCKSCGAKESVITHTKEGNQWCHKCGHWTKVKNK